VFYLRRPSAAVLDRIVSEQKSRELTYAEHGATSAELPAGYRHDRWHADLGPFDPASFELASRALMSWRIQLGAGLTCWPGAAIKPGSTFVLLMRLPLVFATAAGRVVTVLDEPERCGFAYGTLPGHPEQGEESFLVAREGDRFAFRVVAFSRPRQLAARLGAPVSRALQLRANRRYLDTMREVVGVPPGGRPAR
jgi:uncharacterized protein (UPF0548 family)